MKAGWNLDKGALVADGRSVLERLGGGRRYEVYLVWDEARSHEVVAKILRPDRLDDERAVGALRREAEILARCVHPVLVRSFGAVLEGQYPHLLLEYLDAANLLDVVEAEVTLSTGEALSLALELLFALHHMALQRVVHLDVKPSNIVMSDPPRLIDLGAARTMDELASRCTPIGTASYMAPEQCDPTSALGAIGPQADVWGVGATLYHVLTGTKPFSRPGPRGSDPLVRYPQLAERPRRHGSSWCPKGNDHPSPGSGLNTGIEGYRAGSARAPSRCPQREDRLEHWVRRARGAPPGLH